MNAITPIAATALRRYCEDCRFCEVPATGKHYARCTNPKADTMTLSDRFVSREFDERPYAATTRDTGGKCGPGAVLFEAASAVTEPA